MSIEVSLFHVFSTIALIPVTICGYSKKMLEELKQKAIEKTATTTTVATATTTGTATPIATTATTTTATTESNNIDDNSDRRTLVFPLHYFEGINQFKSMIRDLQGDFKQLIGDTTVIFGMKKGTSIGNSLVRNKALCTETPSNIGNQKCNAPGCRQCPLVNTQHQITINNTNISIPRSLNCKSRNIIYLWKCKLCPPNECYFGRTTQKCHARTNGHRSCFSLSGDEEKWEKSALSMHAREVHSTNFTLENFQISVVKKISPQNIRREEFRFIEKYRTIQLGLNRYKAS